MRSRGLAAAALVTVVAAACQNNPVDTPLTQLAFVQPAGGATGVDPAASIAVGFDHEMMSGMEEFMALHTGTVNGPTVPGGWTWSDGHTRVTFHPAAPLMPHTRYVIHLGGGLMDAQGHMAGFEHGAVMGGMWVSRSTMGGGMMGGAGTMMGPGWRHPNGSQGMMFEFTTK